MSWEEREKRGKSTEEAEEAVGGEGEALPVEGDDGEGEVEGGGEGGDGGCGGHGQG